VRDPTGSQINCFVSMDSKANTPESRASFTMYAVPADDSPVSIPSHIASSVTRFASGNVDKRANTWSFYS